ncbi:MAG TPA: indole-3-glycerol phosphate synthase TrpC [Steroidobacteraceae bacterium]|nr:indole-3-glycerol phosphate synthase TrpC [Steroidobacteraceae bacterium]
MSGFLDEMAAGSRARLDAARSRRPLAALEAEARRRPPPPPLRLDPSGFDLIAELKLRSPAAGTLAAAGVDIAARVGAYARSGAAAVSVLTEPSRFDGSLAHLTEAAGALAPLAVPAMRKDFLVDPYQVFEARAAGAGGVLVILRLLPPGDTAALIECAASLGLFVLLEAFDARDVELMHRLIGAHRGANQLLAGLNCRDLATLEVSPGRLTELAPLLPAELPRVAESGVASEADARAVAEAGYALALVGSALMRGGDPGRLAAALLAAGRAASRGH